MLRASHSILNLLFLSWNSLIFLLRAIVWLIRTESDYKVAGVAEQMSDNSLHDKDDRFSPRVKTMSPLNLYGTVPYHIYNVSFHDRLFS